MGGQAFADSGPNNTPLHIPRMPPSLYKTASSTFQSKLKLLFANVAIPREAPGKQDFGDVDLLVEGALGKWSTASLKEVLGAEFVKGSGGTKSFAVAYCGEWEEGVEERFEEEIRTEQRLEQQSGSQPAARRKYVQVDVDICPCEGSPDSKDLFAWTLFMKSDSDLLQIVGATHYGLGLTCNDRGLHVRVPQIEPYNRKKSLLFLTRDVDAALRFYGFDVQKYWAGFENEEELFEWVVGGRFFLSGVVKETRDNAKEKSRLKKRPMYRRFMDAHVISEGPEFESQDPDPWTRQQVLEEAVKSFDKHSEYKAMMDEHFIRERDTEIWQRVKESIPSRGETLATTLKGLRRWVAFDDGKPFITAEPIITDQPLWGGIVGVDMTDLLAWIDEHHREVRALEKARKISSKAAMGGESAFARKAALEKNT